VPADLHCTFCGRSDLEADQIIAGPPPFFICDACVGRLSQSAAPEEALSRDDVCSFCGMARRRVCLPVGGEGATICDECLGLCRDILAEELDRASK